VGAAEQKGAVEQGVVDDHLSQWQPRGVVRWGKVDVDGGGIDGDVKAPKTATPHPSLTHSHVFSYQLFGLWNQRHLG
jgi:hypothetical protein